MHVLHAEEALHWGFAEAQIDVKQNELKHDSGHEHGDDDEDNATMFRQVVMDYLCKAYHLPVTDDVKDSTADDVHALRQLKAMVHSADHANHIDDGLAFERHVFGSMWGAPLNQRAIAKSGGRTSRE